MQGFLHIFHRELWRWVHKRIEVTVILRIPRLYNGIQLVPKHLRHPIVPGIPVFHRATFGAHERFWRIWLPARPALRTNALLAAAGRRELPVIHQ